MYTTATLAGLVTEQAEPIGQPKKHPLLFIHGMWEGASVWRNYLDFFSAEGYRCYAPYLRGYHDDNPVPHEHIGQVTVSEYLDDVRGAVKELLSLWHEMPILVGHSMGGLLVQKIATEIDLPKVVLIAPAAPFGFVAARTPGLFVMSLRHLPKMWNERPFMLSFKEMKNFLLNGLADENEQRRVYSEMRPASGRQTWDIAVKGLRVDARNVRCPMLVIGAGKDNITPSGMVRKIATRYRPNAKHREYSGFAHMVMIEKDWQTVAKDIAVWLE